MSRDDARRLLLVEDNPADAALIGLHLAGEPAWTMHHVTSGSEAKVALAADSFDVVLLDLGLPDAHGPDLVSELAEEFDIPIVVLTGRPEGAWGSDVLVGGAQDYLSKDDVTPQALRRSLRYAVERQAHVQQLKRAQQRLSRHARAVAHDIRSPLAGIRGFAELIAVEARALQEPAPRITEYAGKIVEQSRRLLDLVAEQLEGSADMAVPGLVDMTQAARWAAEVLRSRIEERRAHLTITRLPQLLGQRTVLRQVLLNLTANVLEHGAADPLELRWSSRRRDDGGWDVVLEDNGADVDKELIRKGQPLPVLPIAPTHDGHGFGLRVVAAAMAEHDGSVWLSSGTAGGLRVTLAFPASASVS